MGLTSLSETEQAMSTTILRLAVCAVIALPLSACSGDDDPSTDEGTPSASNAPASDGTDAEFTVVGQARLVGPGAWALPATGDPVAPLAVLDVPSGFAGREEFVWAEVETFANITYAVPTRVFADPCDAEAPSRRVGPTVEDLAAELAQQGRASTAEPVATEIGGYTGLYLERTVTARDLESCGDPAGLRIWETAVEGGGREYEVAAVDRLWILDAGGRRVVLSVLTQDGTDDETIETLTGVAEAAQFVEAG